MRYPVKSAAALVGTGAAAVVIRLCCLPVFPRPTPLIPDEYSYLLLARTLLAGRLSNPAHPMWRHFETLFVLQQPSYASVYPPVQGGILALGSALFGDPWAGVLASMAAMCAAITWMLCAYVTRAWALYGGLLACAGYGVLSYWANSYWGGCGAAIGGALVFGALPRVTATGRRRDAAILGLGLILLANSRPYEGFLAALPVAFYAARHFGRRQAAVLGCVLAAGAVVTCWYYWRVTGSPFRLPHSEYIRQYAAAPAFVWQPPRRAPEYRDRVLRDAHISFGIDYAGYSTFADAAGKTFRKLAGLAMFYWGPLWALALFALPDFIRERRFRVVAISLAFCLAGILLTVGFQIHYAAPCTGIFVLILVDAVRRFARKLPGAATVLVIVVPAVWIGWQVATLRPASPNSLRMRPSTEAKIAAEPGRHVVFVHYSQSHPLGEEWVYNEPDIDGSRVIWARDLGRQLNDELLHYYPDRTFWIAYPDERPPQVARCAEDCSHTDFAH